MNPLSKLLLVDPDPHGLETLTYGFEREGCTVAGTSDLDPGRAADLVRSASAQVAVVALRDADGGGATPGGGLELIKRLRGANGHSVPVVTLGAPDLRAAAMAAGAADFLSTPLFVRDLVNVGRLLALGADKHAPPATTTATPAEEAVVEIESRLSEYHGLFYVLRAMAVTGRSGILALARGSRRAELTFFEGTLMTAQVASLQGLPAVHQVLLWEEAELMFRFRSVARRTQLHLSSQELVDECERFLRDLAFAARDLGSPRTIYLQAPDHDARSSGLQPSQVGPVLRLFDGHRTLASAIDDSPFRVFDTLRMIKRLRDTGAIIAQAAIAAEGEPRSLMEQWAVQPDLRDVVGERRRSHRRLKPIRMQGGAVKPVTAGKGGTPIPLTVRKSQKTPTPALVLATLKPAPAPMLPC